MSEVLQELCQVWYFTRKTYRIQHIDLLMTKVYYSENTEQNQQRKKFMRPSLEERTLKLPKSSPSRAIQDVLNSSSKAEENVQNMQSDDYHRCSLGTKYPRFSSRALLHSTLTQFIPEFQMLRRKEELGLEHIVCISRIGIASLLFI